VRRPVWIAGDGPEGRIGPPNRGIGAHLPLHDGLIVAIRLRFNAMHTSLHSALTRSRPLMLNCRNPSTCLTQPLGGSAIRLKDDRISPPRALHKRTRPDLGASSRTPADQYTNGGSEPRVRSEDERPFERSFMSIEIADP
jgi:hypothetical protein